jgi:putative ABC transport system permease protein
MTVKKGDEFYNETKIVYADSTFFKVFTFPGISGETNRALDDPNTVVTTESTARKYFRKTEVVGKIIETNNNKAYKVTAVIKDMPQNSHFNFDFIISMKSVDYRWENYFNHNFYTYLLLRKGVNYKEFEGNLNNYVIKYLLPIFQQSMNIKTMQDFEKTGNSMKYSLISLKDIHLYSDRSFELSPNGDIKYVYIFSAIALFILLIACINFMNLTTARSANRAREIGIRKVLGTERKNLIIQFLIESVLMSLVAFVLAIILTDVILPLADNITGMELSSSGAFSFTIIPYMFLLSLAVGLIAGSYPAFYLSGFIPIQVLKGKIRTSAKSKDLRGILVVFQFVTSIVLITGTIIIYQQLKYIQNKDLGFKKDQVLIINDSNVLGESIDVFKEKMLSIPGVSCGTISGYNPVNSELRNNIIFFREPVKNLKKSFTLQTWFADYDYLKTLGMQISEGRYFSKDFRTDSSGIILNEAAVKLLGLKDPIGQIIYTGNFNKGKIAGYNIIGVVKDFHFESLREEIAPLSFILGRNTNASLFKINTADISTILGKTKEIWESLAPGMPFSYKFMNESFNEIYKSEEQVGKTALTFTILAIMIACLGLFSLAAFMAEQRTKEIGIRKVLGASVPTILIMLSKEFIKWVVLANIVAIPVAYYFMSKWLQDFAYRINISIWMFIIAGTITLIIALATISFQAIKAAVADPVKSLKYE